MKQITIADTIGALCSDDYKGPNRQYINQGKVVIIESICGSAIRWLGGSAESRTTTAFRRICVGGTENIVTEKTQYAVRRLTPTECERLQGLPDDYTLIDDKTCSDSARYKALGNGMAQPCADYVIRRIVEEVEKERTE